MTIKYTNDKNFKILDQILGAYQSWFSGIVSHVFCDGPLPEAPVVFFTWLKTVSFENIDIEGRYAQEEGKLLNQHKELEREVSSLAGGPAVFESFSEKFNAFVYDLHIFCKNIAFEQSGLDVLTGLQNNAVVKQELMIEMERLAREGWPFSLGLARIDDFHVIEENLGPERADALVKMVAGFIWKSLRSYDDAYRVSRDHFIMCLKQSDMIGGQKALERLRDVLEGAGKVYTLKGEERKLSVSCCVAAPFPGDDLNDLIDNLYVDLDKQIKDSGSVLTYQAMSPLQRFMKEEKE